MRARVSSCSSRHQVTSVVSPKVQIMAIPAPLSGCASGCLDLDLNAKQRGGDGGAEQRLVTLIVRVCHESHTGGQQLGAVVSIQTFSPLGRWKLMRWYAPGRSLSSSSACATAVRKVTSHMVGASAM